MSDFFKPTRSVSIQTGTSTRIVGEEATRPVPENMHCFSPDYADLLLNLAYNAVIYLKTENDWGLKTILETLDENDIDRIEASYDQMEKDLGGGRMTGPWRARRGG